MKVTNHNIYTSLNLINKEAKFKNYLLDVTVKETVSTGKEIGSGEFGSVYEHIYDNELVVKKIKKDVFNDIEYLLDESIKESNYFNKYYGNNSSRVVFTGGDIYIEMLKIPGLVISNVNCGGFKCDAKERFWDMIFKLDSCGIWHGDLSVNNVLYDFETNMFFPIDFSNRAEKHNNFSLSTNSNEMDTIISTEEIKAIIKYIDKNLM